MLTSTERGVKPLLQWLDGENRVKGFSAVDKVVGRAAAFLYVLLEVKEVYAGVMSEGAAHYFICAGLWVFVYPLHFSPMQRPCRNPSQKSRNLSSSLSRIYNAAGR